MKNKIKFNFIGLILSGVVLQGCESAQSSVSMPSINEAIPVKVLPLELVNSKHKIEVSGHFTTEDETYLSFKTGGIANKILVKEGDRIRKGQLLACLDLTEIKTQVNQAQLELIKAERDFNRAKNLYKDSVVTLEQYQNAETGLHLAEQHLKVAKYNLNFSEIRAVSDGFVLKKYINPGQLVSPGANIFKTNGAGNASWSFKAGINDKERTILKPGDSALIFTDAMPGLPVKASIIRKSEAPDDLTGSFSVDLQISGQNSKWLASGLFGTATIFPSQSDKMWTIPHEAILDANASKGFVFVTSDGKMARKIPVSISSITNNYASISAGLENETLIITTGSAYLSDSSLIKILK